MPHKKYKQHQLKISQQHIIKQTAICVATLITTAVVCFFLQTAFSYKIVAIIFLFVVSLFAITLDIVPVLITSILAALILNFFFIPPLYTFHIAGTDDILLFIVFLIVAIINAVLTHKIRKVQSEIRDKQEKENIIKLYNTLLNSLSHELRTPIATIIASTDTLQNLSENLSNQNKKILLEQISIASTRLNDQVNNLLNMSRLETGMLQLKKSYYDINEIITETINKAEKNPQCQIIYQLNDNLPLVNIDAGIMEQILQNILNNAINYTPPHTTVSITTEFLENILKIMIADNGNGVDDKILPFLFDKFYRVPKTLTGGSGLGLSIVKGYVDAHNGTVKALHNTPKGLIIEICLPVETSYINKLKNE